MQLAHAARLLADARSFAALAPLAAAAGVDGPPVTLSRATRASAGLTDAGVIRARLVTGPGALRALLADVDGRSTPRALRDTARALATTLARHAPELLWLLVLRDDTDDGPHAGDVTLAAWSPTPRGPRVVALTSNPARVLDSDADTLRALAACADPDPAGTTSAATADLRTHAGWLDALGRDALGARFYHALEHTVDALARSTGLADAEPARELALVYTTRLLFLAFLQAKHWLDGDPAFLARHFDACMATGGRYHDRVLRPLFFGTLNTPRRHRATTARSFGRIPFLNGGLFAPTRLERRFRTARFGDPELGALVVTLLGRHRFTAREDSTTWSEAAVDPEMLGRAFESLMHADDRRASGAFYTPQTLVDHATTAALRAALLAGDRGADTAPAAVDAALAGRPLDAVDAARLRARLADLRVLDPACGSGAFLVHALERLATLHTLAGDPRPTSELRRAVCATSIFGVDVNPTAVWLCELRLWLSVVIDHDERDPDRVPPLPNLDHNVRVGDALAVPPALAALTRHAWGGAPWGTTAPVPNAGASGTAALRSRYAALAGPRKLAAARRLDALERAHALATFDRALAQLRHARRDLLDALRTRDLFGARRTPDRATTARLAALRADVRALARRRAALAAGGALPFGFAWHFPDAAAAGGFDVLL
ncbi:MAG TPA: DNA methyltransferase, partial [Gemmatirosa sp.]